MFREIPVKYFGCTHRAVDPDETIRKVEGKLKFAGVTRIAEITHLDRLGVPVYSAIRPGAAEGAVSIYAGKGATKDQAKASAMMEAMERYSAEYNEADSEKINSHPCDPENCINPSSLILPKGLTFNKSTTLDWYPIKNSITDEEYLAPANAIFHPFNPIGGIQLFKSNTNGLASGNVLEEAVFHGLMEVVERDAWSIFEAQRKMRPELTCKDAQNPLIDELLKRFQESGIKVKLIDLTADIKITTIAAVADDETLKDPALLTMGVGTHLDPEIAAIRALTEVAQSRATQIHGTREDTARAMIMRKAGYERMKRINRHWFGDCDKKENISEIENKSTSSFKKDLDLSLEELGSVGIENVYFADLTRQEIEVPVVRVLIPGLEVYAVDPERMGERVRKSVMS